MGFFDRYSYSPYEMCSKDVLNSKTAGNSVRGFLIKGEGASGSGSGVGYGVLQSWPSLGDPKCEVLLRELGRNKLNHPLLKQLIANMKIDFDLRQAGTWCFEGLELPVNHLTVNAIELLDSMSISDFETFKIKAGFHLERDITFFRNLLARLPTDSSVRIDFNSNSAIQFLESLTDSELTRIDFIEDPGPENIDFLRELKSKFPCKIALDRRKNPLNQYLSNPIDEVDVMVVKPAYESWNDQFVGAGYQWCFTSNMDHALGVVQAMYHVAIAAKSGVQISDCGFLTHLLFEKDEFSKLLDVSRGKLVVPRGFGFGFEEQLNSIEWRPVG